MAEPSTTSDTAPDPGEIVRAWWRELKERRGDRAELRRAHTLTEVVFTPAYQRLWRRLRGSQWSKADSIALVAGVLAHVDEDDANRSFAQHLAAVDTAGGRPRYSGLRFRRLLQYRESGELLEPAIRAVALIGRKTNVSSLAGNLYWWNDRVRRQLAFDYYAQNPKAD